MPNAVLQTQQAACKKLDAMRASTAITASKTGLYRQPDVIVREEVYTP
jgi:hypothetical protein